MARKPNSDSFNHDFRSAHKLRQNYSGDGEPAQPIEEDDDFIYYGGGARQVKPHREPDPGDEDYQRTLDEDELDEDTSDWDDDWDEVDDEEYTDEDGAEEEDE